jgi:hypothetical protein
VRTLEKHLIPEANGTRLDYDNDGRMDVLIVNGAGVDVLELGLARKIPTPHRSGIYLFHNLGKLRLWGLQLSEYGPCLELAIPG